VESTTPREPHRDGNPGGHLNSIVSSGRLPPPRRHFIPWAAAALLALAHPAGATTIVARSDGTGDVPTLQAGIDCLLGLTCNPSPDSLVVEPGQYAEDVVFDMSAPAIAGRLVCPAGPLATRVRSVAAAPGTSARCVVQGLQVDQAVQSSESCAALSWQACRFLGNVQSHGSIGGQSFSDCEFRGRVDVAGAGALDRCQFVGARAALRLTIFGLSVRDCLFQDCADTAVVATPGDASNIEFERCVFRSVDRAIVVNPLPDYSRDGLLVNACRFEDVRYEAISYDKASQWAGNWLRVEVNHSRFERCGAGVRMASDRCLHLTMTADTLQELNASAIAATANLSWKLDSLVIRANGGDGIALNEIALQPAAFRAITRCRIESNQGGVVVQGQSHQDSPIRRMTSNVIAGNQGHGAQLTVGVSGDSVLSNTVARNGGAGLLLTPAPNGAAPVVFVERNLAVENHQAGIAFVGAFDGNTGSNDAWRNWAGDFSGPDPALNMSIDPLFCDPAVLDFRVAANSPCGPDAPNGQIGALGVGCDARVIAVDPVSGPALAIERVVPNPVSSGRGVNVSFTLPAPQAATLEVVDASGRRISSHPVAAASAGSHLAKLAVGERLAPGIYWVRVVQGGRSAASKVCVLP